MKVLTLSAAGRQAREKAKASGALDYVPSTPVAPKAPVKPKAVVCAHTARLLKVKKGGLRYTEHATQRANQRFRGNRLKQLVDTTVNFDVTAWSIVRKDGDVVKLRNNKGKFHIIVDTVKSTVITVY